MSVHGSHIVFTDGQRAYEYTAINCIFVCILGANLAFLWQYMLIKDMQFVEWQLMVLSRTNNVRGVVILEFVLDDVAFHS